MIAIVPARSGSKRMPNKNFVPFAGTTLVDWAISQAIYSGIKTYVSVNDPGWIPRDSRALVIRRPDFLADDLASTWDVLEHVGYTVGHFGKFVLLQPTSPLRSQDDIRSCIELAAEKSQNVTSCDKWGNPNGAIYVRAWKKWMDPGISYHMPWSRSCDIDLECDFDAAQNLMAEDYIHAITGNGNSCA